MTKIVHNSHKNILCKKSNEKIYLIMQFFLPDNKSRLKELQETMYFNVQNKHFDKIYLLNEKYYTKEELGVASVSKENVQKIVQRNINARLSFKEVFSFVKREKLNGYIVIANTDIFFDYTIENILKTNLENHKGMYALVRYEYTNRNLKKCKLFGNGRADSQDVWIVHSNYIPENTNIFKFNFGVPGCDNKLVYLFLILGYKVYNDPILIRSYHNHASQLRNYNGFINTPHCYLIPQMPSKQHISKLCKNTHLLKDHKNIEEKTNYFENMVYGDNELFIEYLSKKIKKNENFVIPRIAGVENNVVYVTYKLNNKMENKLIEYYEGKLNIQDEKLMNYIKDEIHFSGIKNYLKVMKNNAGILISNPYTLVKYMLDYMKAFYNCELFLGWERWGNVYKYIVDSHNFITNKYKFKNKMCAMVLDVFNYIHNPWTQVLKGKRILIVSSFIESIKEKISIRKEIYGVDLFPECTFVFAKPPQTQGLIRSDDYYKELEPFLKKLDTLKNDFDIALVSCGGYGNIVTNYIYEMGNSAIYVGGALQMYFGIYGGRYMRERSDILKLYLNKHWTRPKNEEKPEGFENVEGSAYW
tara:strand:- start:1047 stop:2804 length:1758 start_codon:yes stop_codon:yes gene_type:complete